MSLKTKKIVLAFSVSLSLVLISTLLFSSSVMGYSGGLLNGVPLNVGSDIGVTNTTTSLLTDNNTSTNYVLGTIGTNSDTIWYKFSSPATITAYQLKASSNSELSLTFRKSDLSQINTYFSADINGTKTSVSLSDVSYVGLINTNSSTKTIYEFDVFGVLPTQTPTATPTPTPIATPTIEPTPTPTSEPIATPTPEIPSGDRAILTVTLTTGNDKEFDLPMSEVNSFLSWYDSASGSARYGVDMHDNNKGPFSKRTEYVIHDKILSFEVSEYNITE